MSRAAASTVVEIRDWARVPEHLAILLVDLAQQECVSVRRLRGDSREARLIELRRRFAQMADEEGYSSTVIGRALNRDHTTVLHHLGRLS